MTPLVSIIIPTFNRAHLLEQTLRSVLEQTYRNWECIIVDDGSTDNTQDLVKSFAEKDERFCFYHRPNFLPKGGNSCRNFGFKKSKGTYIQWLDSDDILLPKKIEVQVNCLEEEAENAVAICKFGYFKHLLENTYLRENIATYQNFESGEKLLVSFGQNKEYFPQHVYLVPRKLILKTSLWDENLSINQDGEFFTRILLKANQVKFLNTGVFYRKSDQEQVSNIDSTFKAQDIINSWKLIHSHIYKSTGQTNHPYVETAKKIIIQQCGVQFSQILNNNYTFLKSALPLYQRLLKNKF